MNKNDSTTENGQNPSFCNIDNITRCFECNLLSSLNLYYKEGTPKINYFCENDHKGDISLEEYLNNYKNYSLIKQKCDECHKNQSEVIGVFSYCCTCHKFICYSCILNHLKHNTIDYRRYDSICKIHSYHFDCYCIKCKKNICAFCKSQHKSHEKVDLSDLFYSEESKNKLKEEINNIGKKINDLDIIKEEIISEINKLKKTRELELKFFKILFYTYEYEETQKNINYNAIQNLRNLEELIKTKIYENIYKEGKNFISFLQNINLSIEQINLFKKNFKILNNQTKSVNQLSQLKDGRLISSFDSILNIYKKDTFELQISIKENNAFIIFFTQLNNDKLITCSYTTMNIIKLIDEDKYNFEQILTGDTDFFCNVIEIRENELISVSFEKIMNVQKKKSFKVHILTLTVIF